MKNDIRRLYIIYDGYLDLASGISRIILLQLRGMRELSVSTDVRLICLGAKSDFFTKIPKDVKIINQANFTRSTNLLSRLISELIFQFSVKIQDPEVIIHVFGSSSWRTRIDVVTAQDCLLAYYLRAKIYNIVHWSAWPYYNYFIKAEQVTYDKAETVIVPCEQVKHELTLYNVDMDKIDVIPNPIDTGYFHCYKKKELRERIRARFSLSDDEFVLLFVGNYPKRKGLDFLIKALRQIAIKEKIKLLVLGTVGNQYIILIKNMGMTEK